MAPTAKPQKGSRMSPSSSSSSSSFSGHDFESDSSRGAVPKRRGRGEEDHSSQGEDAENATMVTSNAITSSSSPERTTTIMDLKNELQRLSFAFNPSQPSARANVNPQPQYQPVNLKPSRGSARAGKNDSGVADVSNDGYQERMRAGFIQNPSIIQPENLKFFKHNSKTYRMNSGDIDSIVQLPDGIRIPPVYKVYEFHELSPEEQQNIGLELSKREENMARLNLKVYNPPTQQLPNMASSRNESTGSCRLCIRCSVHKSSCCSSKPLETIRYEKELKELQGQMNMILEIMFGQNGEQSIDQIRKNFDEIKDFQSKFSMLSQRVYYFCADFEQSLMRLTKLEDRFIKLTKCSSKTLALVSSMQESNSEAAAANQQLSNGTANQNPRLDPGVSTLNNQVPPGMRANNYWDNFRSYSCQNQFSYPIEPSNPLNTPRQVPSTPTGHQSLPFAFPVNTTQSATTSMAPNVAQVMPQQLHHKDIRQPNNAQPERVINGQPCNSPFSSTARPRQKQKINREQNRDGRGGQPERLDRSPDNPTPAGVVVLPKLKEKSNSDDSLDEDNPWTKQYRERIATIVNRLLSEHCYDFVILRRIFNEVESLEKRLELLLPYEKAMIRSKRRNPRGNADENQSASGESSSESGSSIAKSEEQEKMLEDLSTALKKLQRRQKKKTEVAAKQEDTDINDGVKEDCVTETTTAADSVDDENSEHPEADQAQNVLAMSRRNGNEEWKNHEKEKANQSAKPSASGAQPQSMERLNITERMLKEEASSKTIIDEMLEFNVSSEKDDEDDNDDQEPSSDSF